MLNYSSTWANLSSVNGSISTAVLNTYTISLGAYAWFLVIFATMIVVYLRTQSSGLAIFVGVLFFALAQAFVGLVGQGIFVLLVILGIAIMLYRLWKG